MLRLKKVFFFREHPTSKNRTRLTNRTRYIVFWITGTTYILNITVKLKVYDYRRENSGFFLTRGLNFLNLQLLILEVVGHQFKNVRLVGFIHLLKSIILHIKFPVL